MRGAEPVAAECSAESRISGRDQLLKRGSGCHGSPGAIYCPGNNKAFGINTSTRNNNAPRHCNVGCKFIRFPIQGKIIILMMGCLLSQTLLGYLKCGTQ